MRLVFTTSVGAILVSVLLVCGCGESDGPVTVDRSSGSAGGTGAAGSATNGAYTFTLTDGTMPGTGLPGGFRPLSLSGETVPVEGEVSPPPDGVGKVVLPDGSSYEGEIIGGKPNGRGTGTWPGGKKYVGEVRDGEPEGEGVVVEPNGTRQEGEWRGGAEYRVRGTWVAPDGTWEEGTWNRDGTASGGTITWKDGRVYKGGWKLEAGIPELPEGAGEMTWPDGRKYVGQFRGGKMEGPGRMSYADGRVEEGMWKQDEFVGAAR